LPVVLILLIGLSLVVLYSHRALLVEQRSSAQQLRATRALHAAEAGRDWAIALLNRPGPIDALCRPSTATAASPGSSLRERYLVTDPASGLTGPAVTARPGCAQADDTSWTCACPDSGTAALAAPDPGSSAGDRAAFTVGFTTGPQPGSLRLDVTGCSGVGIGCGGADPPDARAEVRQLLHTLGALLRLPAAALVSAGNATVGGGSTVVNTDAASGGVTVQGGAGVMVDTLARLVAPPGRPPADSIVTADTSLAGAGDTLLQRSFGLAADTLRALPGWHHLPCPGGHCSASAVTAAIDGGERALWLDGSLAVASEVEWGSASRPVLLVVRGAATFTGPLRVHGLVIADQFSWQHPGAGAARLVGALFSLGSSTLGGGVELVRDPATLLRLRELPGAYLPVPGGWQDFDTR
jgi:hypothetical protein